MATVVGKTSTRIDQLLADLLTNISVADGNLVFTRHDGTEVNLGNISGVKRIFYTNGAWPARPVATDSVQWIGPTQPPNMTERDDWLIVP